MHALLAAVLAVHPAVDTARFHLSKGSLADVVADLKGARFGPADRADAAQVLADAAVFARDGRDDAMALKLARLALELDPRKPIALEVAAQAAFSQQRWADAKAAADRWLKLEPKSPAARLLRAKLCARDGEWDAVLRHLAAAPSDSFEASDLKARAEQEQADRARGLTTVDALERAMRDAPVDRQPVAARPSGGVVLYGTEWCGYCKKARAWLTKRRIQFVDRDVEADPAAAAELAAKAAALGLKLRGVPVIDVRGQLMVGFGEEAYAELF